MRTANEQALMERAEADDLRFDELNRTNGHFEIVGHGAGGKKYILVRNPSRLLAKTANQMGLTTLLQIAPVEWWAKHFPARLWHEKFDKRGAVSFVFRVAVRVGNFDLLTAMDPSAI